MGQHLPEVREMQSRYILKLRATSFNLFDTKQEDAIYTHKANYSLHKNEDNFKRQQKRA